MNHNFYAKYMFTVYWSCHEKNKLSDTYVFILKSCMCSFEITCSIRVETKLPELHEAIQFILYLPVIMQHMISQ